MAVARRPPRAELAEWACALHAAGWTARRIAAELEVSRSYAADLYLDPTGEKGRARKRSYGGTCERCGATTDGSNGRALAPKLCASCAAVRDHEERLWTSERIIECFKAFYAGMGRSPTVVDVPSFGYSPSVAGKLSPERIAEVDRAVALGLTLPSAGFVSREFGSWAQALEAAGLPANVGGGPSHRGVRRRAVRDTTRVARRPAQRSQPAAEPVTHTASECICPDCGRYVDALIVRTGFCRKCTFESDQREAAA